MQRSAVRTLRLLAMLLAAVALLIPAAAAAHSHGKRHQQRHHSKHHARDHGNQAAPNALYTTTNGPARGQRGDHVHPPRRRDHHPDRVAGRHRRQRRRGREPPFGFPIVDSSGSTNLTPDGKLLFVVNAGDNSISSFRTTSAGPVLVSHVSSGGTLPISLTSHGNLLYVVNETSANIKGWTFDSTGHLTPIPGSVESLSVPFNPTSPRPDDAHRRRRGDRLLAQRPPAGRDDPRTARAQRRDRRVLSRLARRSRARGRPPVTDAEPVRLLVRRAEQPARQRRGVRGDAFGHRGKPGRLAAEPGRSVAVLRVGRVVQAQPLGRPDVQG